MLEERSLHPRTHNSQEGASIAEAKIILFLSAHTILTMMMTRRIRRRTGRKRKRGRTREEEEGWFICGHLG